MAFPADAPAGGPDALDDLADLQGRLVGMRSQRITVLEEHDLILPFRKTAMPGR